MRFTAQAYYEASLEHVGVARELLEQQNYALANYVAGLSVECMFRAYSYHYDRHFDCRHDLSAWYDAAHFDEFVPVSNRLEIAAAYGVVVTHWTNSQRYCSLKFLKAYFKQAQLDRGIRGDFVKELSRRTVRAAFELVSLGNLQWINLSKR